MTPQLLVVCCCCCFVLFFVVVVLVFLGFFGLSDIQFYWRSPVVIFVMTFWCFQLDCELRVPDRCLNKLKSPLRVFVCLPFKQIRSRNIFRNVLPRKQ